MCLLTCMIFASGFISHAANIDSGFIFSAGKGTTREVVSCYGPETAYIVYGMNIRELPTTQSDKVGIQYANTKISVIESQQGETWCWLRTDKGWIAKTGRVSEKKPVETPKPVAETAEPVVETVQYTSREGLPPIYGDEGFINAVAAGFNFLRNNKPQWFEYVSIIDDVKLKPHKCSGRPLACAGWPYKVVYFTELHKEYGYDVPSIASTLIHEACHFYQWKEGRGDGYSYDPEGYEAECEGKEREAGL